MRKVVLTLKESEKYLTIKKLIESNGNKRCAATKLKLTLRQINRLIAGYNKFGKEFFVHGNRGRIPSHALSLDHKNTIEDLYNNKYFDCTYTLFAELLAQRENIFVSIDEVRSILNERYILSPKSHKASRKRIKKLLLQQQMLISSKKDLIKIQESIVALEDAHPRQPRCLYFGEEIQLDASIHLWFGNFKSSLHAAIDDATGQVVAAYFDTQETLNGYYHIYHQILTNYRYSLSI